jgi:hypothetical protein
MKKGNGMIIVSFLFFANNNVLADGLFAKPSKKGQ